jgi:hypothetical protein
LIGEANCQWAVIHKGMMESIDFALLKRISREWLPVFANEVFVVFSNQTQLSKLPINSLHLPFFWTKLKELEVAFIPKNN